MKYIMYRDVTVTSVLGHTLHFKKGEPTNVPPAMATLVQERGGVPAEGEAVHKDEPKKPAEPQGTERLDIMVASIEAIVAKNARNDFGANGLPTAKAISRESGFHVDAKERTQAWEKYKAEENS